MPTDVLVDGGAARLAAANQKRRDQKSERLCRELAGRLPGMPRTMLAALALTVLAECDRRSRITTDEFVDGEVA